MSLRRRARAAARKAAGSDGWSGTHFAALPLPFFEALSRNLVLDGAPLPETWLSVKVVGVPKPEGGTDTFPSELCGSIPGRRVEDVHQVLDALCSCRPRQRQEQYAGYKADLRKCYDQVVMEFAIQAWVHLGGSGRIASLLRRFYNFQQRFVSVQGVFARDPVIGAQSLLHFCPFSSTRSPLFGLVVCGSASLLFVFAPTWTTGPSGCKAGTPLGLWWRWRRTWWRSTLVLSGCCCPVAVSWKLSWSSTVL